MSIHSIFSIPSFLHVSFSSVLLLLCFLTVLPVASFQYSPSISFIPLLSPLSISLAFAIRRLQALRELRKQKNKNIRARVSISDNLPCLSWRVSISFSYTSESPWHYWSLIPPLWETDSHGPIWAFPPAFVLRYKALGIAKIKKKMVYPSSIFHCSFTGKNGHSLQHNAPMVNNWKA